MSESETTGNTTTEAGVPDGDQPIQVIMISPDGIEDPSGETAQWNADDPLPHTSQSFDDPMGRMTTEEWKKRLTGAARAAVDANELRDALLFFIGQDLYYSHKIPAPVIEAGLTKYSEWLFGEYHNAVAE